MSRRSSHIVTMKNWVSRYIIPTPCLRHPEPSTHYLVGEWVTSTGSLIYQGFTCERMNGYLYSIVPCLWTQMAVVITSHCPCACNLHPGVPVPGSALQVQRSLSFTRNNSSSSTFTNLSPNTELPLSSNTLHHMQAVHLIHPSPPPTLPFDLIFTTPE